MKKRIFSLAFALILCLSLAVLPASAYEVRYEAAADALWEDGLFLGDGTSFALDQPLVRSAGVVMVLRLLGKLEEAQQGTWETPFTDMDGYAWAQPYVGYAYTHGIIYGTGETTFSPGLQMDARQFITLVLRALGYRDTGDNKDFTYMDAISKALDIGLIGQPCYQEYTTTNEFRRDNAAQISWMALELNKNGTDTPLRSTINIPGRPAGDMPYATAAQAEAAKNSGEKRYPYKDAQGRTHFALIINDRDTGREAFQDTEGRVWLPVTETFAALQYDWSYSNSDQETISIKLANKTTNLFSATLYTENNCLYIIGSMFPIFMDGAQAGISSDNTTYTLTAPTGTFTGTAAGASLFGGSSSVTVDTSNNDADFKLVWGQNGSNMTNTYRYAGGQAYAVDYLFTLYAGSGGTYTMTFPYSEDKAHTVTFYTTPGGVYDLTYTYALQGSSNYNYTYDMDITLSGPNSASLHTRDQHPGPLSAGGLSYKKVDGPTVTPEGAHTCLSCNGDGCDLCHWNGCFGPEAGSQVCPVCSGTGRMVCPECSGEGYKPQTITSSGGLYSKYQDEAAQYYENQKKCPTCNNVLTVPCTSCGGDGYQ